MTDLDQMLGALRAMPIDVRLAATEGAIIASVARRRDLATARRSLMLAGLLAVGVGWASNFVPGTPAQAAPAPIGMSDYAPSRLLGQ